MSYNMKYIKKVILENFQSHKYTEIEFDKYLNVIVGPSDQGKSAIIRALKWALFNEPSGDFFIREGEKECSVTVIFNDNVKVKRYRSKNKNSYYLYDEKGEETIFEGFGTTVPKEIIDKTSIRKVLLDSNQSNSINIGEQLEGPFLLSEKNSTRANAIGRLVGVHIIDDALKNTLKDTRNLNIRKKSYEESLEKLQKDLEEYDYLNSLIRTTEQLDRIREHIKNNEVKLDKLTQISLDLNKINKEIKLTKEYLKMLKNLHKLIDIEKKLNNKIKNFNYINNKYTRFIQIDNEIKLDNILLSNLKELHKVETFIETIDSNYKKINKLNGIYINLKHNINNIMFNKNILLKLKGVHNVEKNISLIGKKTSILLELTNLKYKMDNVNKSLSIGTIYIEKLKHIDLVVNIINVLEVKYNQLKKLIDYKKEYDIVNNKKLEVEKNIEDIKKILDEELLKYKQLLTKIEVCPLCFSSIDSSRIEEIISNYK